MISGQSSAAIISDCKDLRVLAALSSQPLRAAERPGWLAAAEFASDAPFAAGATYNGMLKLPSLTMGVVSG